MAGVERTRAETIFARLDMRFPTPLCPLGMPANRSDHECRTLARGTRGGRQTLSNPRVMPKGSESQGLQVMQAVWYPCSRKSSASVGTSSRSRMWGGRARCR